MDRAGGPAQVAAILPVDRGRKVGEAGPSRARLQKDAVSRRTDNPDCADYYM